MYIYRYIDIDIYRYRYIDISFVLGRTVNEYTTNALHSALSYY